MIDDDVREASSTVSPAPPEAAEDEDEGEEDDEEAADAADAAAAAAPPTPLGLLVQGIGRQGGIHRLHVTLRNVWSIELRWRCAGCGPFG